jgi:hypothetical protein
MAWYINLLKFLNAFASNKNKVAFKSFSWLTKAQNIIHNTVILHNNKRPEVLGLPSILSNGTKF